MSFHYRWFDREQEKFNELGIPLTRAEIDAHERKKETECLFSRGEQTGIVLPDSPTQNVSADNVAGKKEKHEFPALSLAKTKKVEDLARWAEGKPMDLLETGRPDTCRHL